MKRLKNYLVGEIVNSDYAYLVGAVFNVLLDEVVVSNGKEIWDEIKCISRMTFGDEDLTIDNKGLFHWKGKLGENTIPSIRLPKELQESEIEVVFGNRSSVVETKRKISTPLLISVTDNVAYERIKKMYIQWVMEKYPKTFGIMTTVRDDSERKSIKFLFNEHDGRDMRIAIGLELVEEEVHQ